MNSYVDKKTVQNGEIHYRTVSPENWDNKSQIVMVNGVPVTSMIYDKLAEKIISELPVRIILVDLVGTGGSFLKDKNYNWTAQREAMNCFFNTLDNFTLLVHDAAGPILLPLLSNQDKIKSVIILNTVIKPTKLKPPFPLSIMHKSKIIQPFAALTPRWYYKMKIKEHGIDKAELVTEDFLNKLYSETHKEQGFTRLAKVMNGFELNENSDSIIKKGIESNKPKLVVWADSDPVLGSMLIYLEPLLKEKDCLVKITEAKHFFMLDYADEIARAIVEWYDI